jgi:putative ABC transport system ATP-binding protein
VSVSAVPDVTRLSRRKLSVFRRERVGSVFQALNLVPTLSVAENIALPLRLDGRHVDHKRVREVAGRFRASLACVRDC